MTARALFALLQRLVVAVVLVASGGYLLVYLYRWEWNRALISGLVFVAAEIVMATSVLVRHMSEQAQPPASFDLALARLREAGVERRSPFRWLQPRDQLGVFIPVLLGAGVVLSALAYVLERIAEATARVTVDRRLAQRLAALAPSQPASASVALVQWRGTSPHRIGPLVGVAAAAVILGLATQVLAEATQSRPDDADRPATTTILLAIEQKHPEPAVDAAAALWIACRPVLPARNRPVATIEPVDGRIRLVLEPGIRDLTTRRLKGCLADATLSSVRAQVLAVEHAPPS